MAIEYAISAGEGTLIDYGVLRDIMELRIVETFVDVGIRNGWKWELHKADCPDDCETGR